VRFCLDRIQTVCTIHRTIRIFTRSIHSHPHLFFKDTPREPLLVVFALGCLKNGPPLAAITAVLWKKSRLQWQVLKRSLVLTYEHRRAERRAVRARATTTQPYHGWLSLSLKKSCAWLAWLSGAFFRSLSRGKASLRAAAPGLPRLLAAARYCAYRSLLRRRTSLRAAARIARLDRTHCPGLAR
jgi:hypothetical protein